MLTYCGLEELFQIQNQWFPSAPVFLLIATVCCGTSARKNKDSKQDKTKQMQDYLLRDCTTKPVLL